MDRIDFRDPFFKKIFQFYWNIRRLQTSITGESNNIELLSMHIPKCGGISFRHTLTDNYKEKVYIYHQIRPMPLSQGFRVIHGHFPMKRLAGKFPEARKITWVRHPVSRIISLFNFWKEIRKNDQDFQTIDIVDLASNSYLQSEMQYFFNGYTFDDFFFIGILENYQAELLDLAGKLNWTINNFYLKNISFGNNSLSDAVYRKLADILKEEIDLYNGILKFKGHVIF